MTRPVDVSKVKCYGPGVDRVNPLFSQAPQEFTVDTSEAGDAPLEVTVDAPRRKVLKPEPVCEKGDGVYTVEYTPEEEGKIQEVMNLLLRHLMRVDLYFGTLAVQGPGRWK